MTVPARPVSAHIPVLLDEVVDALAIRPGERHVDAIFGAGGYTRTILERGAEGIGLFRSEFLLAGGGQAALTEEAQYRAYRRLVENAAPRRVTVRTFDVSETQLRLDHAAIEGARGPLGLRGIRLSLAIEEIFQDR